MKKLFTAAILLAAFASAHADTFNFSYTFNDGPVITGSLSGSLNGDFVENISNLHVTFNGTAFSGSLVGGAWDAAAQNWSGAGTAVLSTDASKNNFIFADADPKNNFNNVSNYFYFVNSRDPAMDKQAYGLNCNVGDCADLALDQPTNNSSWSLVAVAAPVPEPATISMLMAGLGFMGAAVRRRRQA